MHRRHESLLDAFDELLHHRIPIVKRKQQHTLFPKRIILIRHGESIANLDRTVYSCVPDNQIPLSDLGKQQADQSGAHLAKLLGSESVLAYFSPYLRSRQTCDAIIAHFKPEQICLKEEPRIREQEWGNFQEVGMMDRVQHERDQVGRFWYRFPCGESGADVYERVSTFLQSLFRQVHRARYDNVLLVSHGLFMRLFLMRYLHWTVDEFHDVWNFRNCESAVLEYNQDTERYVLRTELRRNTNGGHISTDDSGYLPTQRPRDN